jgi:Spy/CpxP family protein refolding chaperone
LAADHPAPANDPLTGAFFPPDMVLAAAGQIGLTQEQQDAFRARVERAQQQSDELRKKLESEAAVLAELARRDRVDEAALLTQLDKVLDAERELKRLHIGLLAAVKNLLTPGQQARLRDIAESGGAQEEIRKRLMEKVRRVQEAAQNWVESGRDPSAIAQAMDGKVKPLVDAGKPLEAEAEIDLLLEQLTKDAK